ncbi:MAG TPA: NAD(+)/NADH kinase, partial [Acidimicrobiales bacterium]|nr:NAD(+)/NADH kinase [Acidimicrobiales bacterium]
MATIVLVVHPRRPNAAEYARKASAWLAERGHSVVMPEEDATALGMAELGVGARRLAGIDEAAVGLDDPRPDPGTRDPAAGPGSSVQETIENVGFLHSRLPEGADAHPAGDGATSEPADSPALAVAMGGDGTVLRAVRLVVERGVPVLGVNLGRLGYLTQVEPDGLIPALERFLAGDH